MHVLQRKTSNPLPHLVQSQPFRAGEGNRTLVISLGSWSNAIIRHPLHFSSNSLLPRNLPGTERDRHAALLRVHPRDTTQPPLLFERDLSLSPLSREPGTARLKRLGAFEFPPWMFISLIASPMVATPGLWRGRAVYGRRIAATPRPGSIASRKQTARERLMHRGAWIDPPGFNHFVCLDRLLSCHPRVVIALAKTAERPR